MVPAVVDTNVLVSAFVTKGKPRQPLDRCLQGDFQLVSSVSLLAEFERVLRYSKLNLNDDEIRGALAIVSAVVDRVDASPRLERVVRDPDDDLVVAVAMAGRADYIVSGDRDLLDVRAYRSIRTVGVVEFVRILARGTRP